MLLFFFLLVRLNHKKDLQSSAQNLIYFLTMCLYGRISDLVAVLLMCHNAIFELFVDWKIIWYCKISVICENGHVCM